MFSFSTSGGSQSLPKPTRYDFLLIIYFLFCLIFFKGGKTYSAWPWQYQDRGCYWVSVLLLILYFLTSYVWIYLGHCIKSQNWHHPLQSLLRLVPIKFPLVRRVSLSRWRGNLIHPLLAHKHLTMMWWRSRLLLGAVLCYLLFATLYLLTFF
jgi:hypothetical protein